MSQGSDAEHTTLTFSLFPSPLLSATLSVFLLLSFTLFSVTLLSVHLMFALTNVYIAKENMFNSLLHKETKLIN